MTSLLRRYGIILPNPGEGVEVTTSQGDHSSARLFHRLYPAGDSTIRLKGAGTVVRIFSPRASDIAALAGNRDASLGPHPTVPEFAL